jgi:hypothetical protein
MYKLPAKNSSTDSSLLNPMDPAVCGVRCANEETQISFTSTSIVRSAQEFAIPANGFTVEFFLKKDGENAPLEPQLIMLYGNTESASIRITLDRLFAVWKCSSFLVVPFEIPLSEWTHFALSMDDASGQVRVFLNGLVILTGKLSDVDCEIPASSFVQFGRGISVVCISGPCWQF